MTKNPIPIPLKIHHCQGELARLNCRGITLMETLVAVGILGIAIGLFVTIVSTVTSLRLQQDLRAAVFKSIDHLATRLEQPDACNAALSSIPPHTNIASWITTPRPINSITLPGGTQPLVSVGGPVLNSKKQYYDTIHESKVCRGSTSDRATHGLFLARHSLQL